MQSSEDINLWRSQLIIKYKSLIKTQKLCKGKEQMIWHCMTVCNVGLCWDFGIADGMKQRSQLDIPRWETWPWEISSLVQNSEGYRFSLADSFFNRRKRSWRYLGPLFGSGFSSGAEEFLSGWIFGRLGLDKFSQRCWSTSSGFELCGFAFQKELKSVSALRFNANECRSIGVWTESALKNIACSAEAENHRDVIIRTSCDKRSFE